MAQIELQGSGVAASTGGGVLSFNAPLAGSGVASGLGDGTLTVGVGLTGSGVAASTGDGVLSFNAPLSGAGEAVATGDGTLSSNVLLAGSGVARALGSGLATRLRSIEGSAVASSSGTGLIDRIRSLFGEGKGTALGSGVVGEAQIQRSSVALDVDSAHVDSDLSGFPVYVDLTDLPDTLLGSFAPDGSDLLARDESGNVLPRELQNLDTVYSGPFKFNSSSAFGLKTNYSYSGSRSIGIENSGTAPNLGAEVTPNELSGGEQIDSFKFYYRETGNSTGGGLRFVDSNGTVILAAYTDNPGWEVYDADGTTEFDDGPSASDYNLWIELEVVFDWGAGTAEVTWTDPNNTSDTASYTATLRSITDVEKLTLNNYSGGDQNYTGGWVMWFDDISFTVGGETTLYDFETRRKIVGGDLYFRAPSLSSSSDTRFLIEKGDSPFSGNPENVWTNGEKAVWHLDSLDPSPDSTSGGNDATDGGNSQLSGGQIGQAVDLDSDDYLEVGNIGVPDLIAIEAWINPDDETSNFNMVAGNRRDVDNQDGWNFGVTYPGFEFKADDGSTYGVGFSSTVPQNQWSHVVALYDGDRAKVFLNGQLDNEADVYNGTLKNSANDPLVLGAMGHDPAQFGLDGQLDEVRVYDTPLSAAYISAQYVNQDSPTTFYTVNDVFVPLGGAGDARSEGNGRLRRTTETRGRGVATSESDSFLTRTTKVVGSGQGTATGSGVVTRPILFGGSGVARGLAEGNLEYSVIFEGTGAAEALGEGIFDYNVIIDGSGTGVATGDVHLSRITPFSGAGTGRAIGTGALGDIVAHWLTVDGATESTDAGNSASLSALDTDKIHVFQVQALDSAYNFSGPATLRASPLDVSEDTVTRSSVSLTIGTPDPSLHGSIKLYRATSQGGPYQEIKEFTDLDTSISYTDSGLSGDTEYFYYAEGTGGNAAVDVESKELSVGTAKPLRKDTGNIQVSSTGELQVSGLGFEPDLIAFEITANRNAYAQDDELTGEEWGWGYGYAHVADGKDYAMAVASGSDSTNGQHTETTTSYSVFLPVTANDGATVDGYIRAKVKSTDGDGFVLQVDDAYRNWHLNWTAYQFGPNGEAEVGFESTPTSTGQQSYVTGFQPNFLKTHCQPHAAIQSGNDSVTDAAENGWGHGVAAERGGTIEQVAASVVMYSENINMHAWGSSDTDALYTVIVDSQEDISGRIRASLSSFDTDGFTLDYDGVESGQPFLYCAIKVAVDPEVGYGRTPTSTGPQTISTAIEPDLLKVLGSNTIADINIEGEIPDNSSDGHHGWMEGIAINGGGQFSQGFSSHSNSVNAHAAGGNDTQGVHLLYTDEDGVILGRDQATVGGLGSTGFELDYSAVVTSSATDVRLDRSLFIWWAFE